MTSRVSLTTTSNIFKLLDLNFNLLSLSQHQILVIDLLNSQPTYQPCLPSHPSTPANPTQIPQRSPRTPTPHPSTTHRIPKLVNKPAFPFALSPLSLTNSSAIPLSASRQKILTSICALYSGSASQEDMQVYAENAVYDDPWSFCDDRFKIAGQWYGMICFPLNPPINPPLL